MTKKAQIIPKGKTDHLSLSHHFHFEPGKVHRAVIGSKPRRMGINTHHETVEYEDVNHEVVN